MSSEYKPRVGDKIRVATEGVVDRLDGDGFHLDTGHDEGWDVVWGDDYTVEVLKKAGPRPGAVAELPGTATYVLLRDGRVRATYQDGYTQILSGPLEQWGTVVYEPPA